MLNDPVQAISWSVVDWRRRPKAAYKTLKLAMQQVLVCVEYPEDSYEVGARISLPLYAVNDLPRALGEVTVSWDLCLGDTDVASGHVEVEIPADSVVEAGRATAILPRPGRAKLRLRLYGQGMDVGNAYDFLVMDAARVHKTTADTRT